MKNRIISLLLVIILLTWTVSCQRDIPEKTQGKYEVAYPSYFAEGNKGMVVGTSGAPAIKAGLEILKNGGSATDAALAISLGQISLAAGCWVSYAGAFTMVHFEAKTGKVTTLNGRYKTPLDENDPLSIPEHGTPSGRSVLVPGFMAAIQAAHDRFGTLPFERIFEPAIYFAEEGFPISPTFWARLQYRKPVLMRLPETRRVFRKQSGVQYQEGDIFLQPELAETLKRVAAQGAEYMYTGQWAKNFVGIVRREGGKITLQDLSNYRVIWEAPLHTTYNGMDVYSMPPPNFGGTMLIEALNLMEAADLKSFGHYSESAEALYRLIKNNRINYFLSIFEDRAEAIIGSIIPGINLSFASRAKKKTARLLWETVNTGQWDKFEVQFAKLSISKHMGGHSDAVVVIDENGNVAAVEHTINTTLWGTTGIFVDGISIPDSASVQQMAVLEAGPGNHLPDPTSPCLVLENNLPVLAGSSVGPGLLITPVMNLHNILDFGMTPKISLQIERVMSPDMDNILSHLIVENDFSVQMIEALRSMGQQVTLIQNDQKYQHTGFWAGIKIDPKSKKLSGGVSFLLRNGTRHAEGY